MNILCCTSNEYSPYAGVMLTSLFENNKNIKFTVYVFTTGLCPDNLERMAMLEKKYGNTICIKNFTEEDLKIKLPGDWGIYPFLKLYAIHVLDDIDNLLYLDTDMIVVSGISELADIDIGDNYIALAPDCGPIAEHRKRLDISSDSFYGNSGLIYYNLKKCRENNIWEKCAAFINNNDSLIRYADQDVFNKVCSGHIYEMGLEWNMQSYYYLNSPKIQPQYKDQLKCKKTKPKVIHYTCIKPWYRDCDFPLKKEYIKYERMLGWNLPHLLSRNYTPLRFYINKLKYILQRLGLHSFDYLYEL